MSTDRPSRRSHRDSRRRRGYLGAFALVLGGLVVVGAGAGAAVALQGPRVTAEQFDPQAAITASGSRLILTTSQALADIDPSQVTVSPDIETTVATSGRAIGLRFALPLYDDTTYTVTITGVTGVGGGPAATITRTFHTPTLEVFMLSRGDDEDTIYRTGLTGTEAEPVFTHTHIEDFRATASALVVSVRTDDDLPALIVTDLAGEDARDLPLPGDGTGTVAELQSADRGDVIGYTYTDADMSADGAQASVLYTASVKRADADAAPTPIRVGEDAVSAASWRFVPDTDRILVLSFEGRLLLAPPDGSDVVDLGDAAGIQGIARGSATAVIQRVDGLYEVDLSDGTAEPLVTADGIDGYLGRVAPLPGGTTLQQFTSNDQTAVYRVDADGAARAVFQAAGTDALLQTCVSPSGRYGAFLVQPDAADNPYRTGYDLPVPASVDTHVIDLDDGSTVSVLAAFAISWCQGPVS
ncbi:MAG: hypothetical protein NT132_11295 [Microbacterium sp.]|uniref:hypothetical protein n=1 Tax=Microbacterium sp. TaxID=51671 RepID=UPI0026166587|nr:hypothetical protein [Microbacterium sp.]MCX6502967.1 hypothetical protein [Microbacterium sp.]